MVKNWLKKITGISAIEEAARVAAQKRVEEEAELAKLRAEKLIVEEEAELARLSPKDRATRKEEPYISVIDTKINPENIRNGFFELDWNEYFIKDLILNSYGTEADPEEEIVDRWFRDIVYQMLNEEGLDTQRGSGYINVVPIAKGKSEVS
jgi:hypothetical protein